MILYQVLNFKIVIDEKFTIKDIITIQDPKNMQNRTVVKFDFVRNNITFEA